MLEYSLRKNPLDKKELSYMAQVNENRSCTDEELINLMARRGTTLTKTDIAAFLQLYGEIIGELLEDGRPLNTSIINTRFSIKGKFYGMDDNFDPSRHTICIRASLGRYLKNKFSQVKVSKGDASFTNPFISEVKDINTRSIDNTVTKGGNIDLIGKHLKFDEDDSEQGVFLINEQGEQIKCPHPAQNKPTLLIINIPFTLESGMYWIEVRTKVTDCGTSTKEVKVGRFKYKLHVT
ncbi:MAG: DNA-binding domain-containing protein [Treponemataceae bacterium]